jgi:type I restriction-modification system methyltransferase subunit
MNTNTMPLEAETRILIDRSLENLGWKLNGKEQNVFYEQPRTEAEKKKLGGKRPDYVLYSKESDKPLIVIEAKKKCSWLIKKHNKTGQGQSAPPLFRARQIIG